MDYGRCCTLTSIICLGFKVIRDHFSCFFNVTFYLYTVKLYLKTQKTKICYSFFSEKVEISHNFHKNRAHDKYKSAQFILKDSLFLFQRFYFLIKLVYRKSLYLNNVFFIGQNKPGQRLYAPVEFCLFLITFNHT